MEIRDLDGWISDLAAKASRDYSSKTLEYEIAREEAGDAWLDEGLWIEYEAKSDFYGWGVDETELKGILCGYGDLAVIDELPETLEEINEIANYFYDEYELYYTKNPKALYAWMYEYYTDTLYEDIDFSEQLFQLGADEVIEPRFSNGDMWIPAVGLCGSNGKDVWDNDLFLYMATKKLELLGFAEEVSRQDIEEMDGRKVLDICDAVLEWDDSLLISFSVVKAISDSGNTYRHYSDCCYYIDNVIEGYCRVFNVDRDEYAERICHAYIEYVKQNDWCDWERIEIREQEGDFETVIEYGVPAADVFF